MKTTTRTYYAITTYRPMDAGSWERIDARTLRAAKIACSARYEGTWRDALLRVATYDPDKRRFRCVAERTLTGRWTSVDRGY